MDQYRKSYEALTNALESLLESDEEPVADTFLPPSLNSCSVSASASCSSIDINMKKRKQSFSPLMSTRRISPSVRISLKNLSIGQDYDDLTESSSDRIMNEPITIKSTHNPNLDLTTLSPFVISTIENLALQSNMSFQETLHEWTRKRDDLETNLALVTSFTNDSYDDIKRFTTHIFDLIRWLFQNNFEEVRTSIPEWDVIEYPLSNLTRLVRIVEDLKNSSLPPPSGDIQTDHNYLTDFIAERETLYFDLVREKSLGWRLMGFEIEKIIDDFQNRVCSWVWHHLNHLNRINTLASSQFQPLDERGGNDRVLVIIHKSIISVGEVIHLLGLSQITVNLLKAATELTLLYFKKSLVIVQNVLDTRKNAVRFPDAKVCFIYESLIQLLDTLHRSQLLSGLSTSTAPLSTHTSSSSIIPDTYLPDITNIFTTLYLAGIEHGLELCAYASRKRTLHVGLKRVIVNVAVRYTVALGFVMASVLEHGATEKIGRRK